MKTFLLRIFSLFLFVSVSSQFSVAQNSIQLENWITYSSILNTVAIDVDSQSRIWVATNGGVYNYNPNDESFEEFRNIDAMLTLDATSVAAYHTKKEIYIGTFDGILEIVSEDYQWTHVLDIQKPNYPNSSIRSIVFNDDIAYIAGGFGLTTFDVNEHVFLQTPPRLGTFPPLTNVNQMVVVNNTLWLAADKGIAKIDLSSSIVNPENWINYTVADGLPNGKIKGIISFNNDIYCFTDTVISRFVDTAFVKIKSTAVWDVIQSIGVYSGQLTFATLFSVRNLDDNVYYSLNDVKDTAMINGFNVNNNSGEMYVYLNNSGFVILNGATDKAQIKPESPVSNLFSNLDIDINGNLWCATEYSGGKGFMRLKKGKWMNFTRRVTPVIKTNDYGRVSCFPDGRIVLSSWGNGYLTLTENGDYYDFKFTDNSNSCLTGVNGDNDFVVTGESAYDSRNGSSWVINFAPNFTGNLIMGQNNNNEYLCSVARTTREFIPLVIDFSSTKWMGSINGYGLQYFNEGADWNSQTDDKSGTYSRSNSQLPSSNINCITIDKSGVIWVGTPNGLAYIISPSNILRDVDPIIKPTSIRVLRSLPINDIMVDALNNKWIATNDGVFIIDPDGVEEIAQITTENSPLITNEVTALATDFNSGKIYFGTRLGLSEAQSFAIKPLESFDIFCYPQPFYPERDGNLTIEGLAADADIRILTTDGKLIKSIQTASQKTVWNGLDESGNKVASGIYVIIGTSLSTEATGMTKFALIRN